MKVQLFGITPLSLSARNTIITVSRARTVFGTGLSRIQPSARQIRAYQIGMGEMQKVMPEGFKVAGPYTPAIVANGTVYCSGAIPNNPLTGELVDGNIGDKTARCCENLKMVLEEAGSSLEKVVKVNIFLDDMGHFKEMNATYEKYFGHRPARSCVAVKQLPLGVPVEIECIAVA